MVDTQQRNTLSNFSKKGESWEIDRSKLTKAPLKIVKKVINPAVYVESAVYDMPQFKGSQGDGDNRVRSTKTVKKCICLTDRKNCPCHPIKTAILSPNKMLTKSLSSHEYISKGLQRRTKCESDSGIELQDSNAQQRIIISEKTEADKHFEEWLEKKLKEQEEKERLRQQLKQQQELEKKKNRESEQENFRRWMLMKKKEEEKRKKEKQLQEETIEKEKPEVVEMSKEEKQLKFQLWLKRKEEESLAKKCKEQMEKNKMDEEKQKRRDENSKAYENWLKSSVNKQKPLPLNQGLDSLRASVSVTYVNPTPWKPNIEVEPDKL